MSVTRSLMPYGELVPFDSTVFTEEAGQPLKTTTNKTRHPLDAWMEGLPQETP